MLSNACVRRRAGARPTSRAHGRAVAIVLVVAAGLALPAAAPARAARQACASATTAPGAAAAASSRRALLCLVNSARLRHGLRPLRADRRLGAAARSHAADMARRNYFAHERPGWTLRGRVRAAGWTGAATAETIAWGCGSLGVPRAVLAGWLASPSHRAIVLGRFTRAGVGLALGSPLPIDCARAGTWVLDVGY